jgi:nitrate reductase gamma subunit
VRRVAVTITWLDLAAYGLLTITIGFGVFETLAVQAFGSSFEYRATIGVWFRHLITFQPETHTVSVARLIFQIHAISALPLYALWPFSRLCTLGAFPSSTSGGPTSFIGGATPPRADAQLAPSRRGGQAPSTLSHPRPGLW